MPLGLPPAAIDTGARKVGTSRSSRFSSSGRNPRSRFAALAGRRYVVTLRANSLRIQENMCETPCEMRPCADCQKRHVGLALTRSIEIAAWMGQDLREFFSRRAPH